MSKNPSNTPNTIDARVTDPTVATHSPGCGVSELGVTDVKRARICHVSMTLQTGGLEKLLVDFSRYHDRKQFELQFVALGELGPPADEIQSQNCPVSTASRGPIERIRQAWRLALLLRKAKIDLVHSHNTYAHFYATLAARLAGVKTILNTQHGRGCGSGWKAKTQFWIANRFTKRIVGVSEDAARLCANDDKLSAKKISTIWNGIDLKKFVFRGPVQKPIAISVARLSPEKDFPTLLRAIPRVLQTVPDFQLRIVGDGSEKPGLEKLACELNVAHSVEFLGERNDVGDLLAEAGFFVSSTLTEGVSLTLLEAMAVGLPILTTSVGGNPEVVVAGKTGQLIEPGQPERLADAIVDMCRDRDLWPSMGELGRQRVEKNFEVRGMVAQYEELYRDLLNLN